MDDLERELRGANPLSARRTSPLSDRAERELSLLTDSATTSVPRSPARPRPRRWAAPAIGFATAAAVAVTLGIVFALTNIGQPPAPSVAAPPLLTVTPLGDGLDDVLAELSRRARAQSDVAPPGEVRLEAWSAQIEADAPESSYYVQPEETERTWAPDLSGTWVTRAGEVRYGTPDAEHPPAEPGTVLRDDVYEAGQFPVLFVDPPPDDAGRLDDYLATVGGLPARSSTTEYFATIEALRLDRTLTGPQTAATLDLISGLPDVTLAGSVTDRLGRPGVAIQTETAAGTHRMLLIFSAETGLLLSSETIYLGGIPDFSLDYPTVLNYYAWKD